MRALARNTDPATSHAAVDTVPLNEQMVDTLAALRSWPGAPPTSAELAAGNTDDRYKYARRLPDLRELGLVENAEARTCKRTGRQAMTWRLCDPKADPQGDLFAWSS